MHSMTGIDAATHAVDPRVDAFDGFWSSVCEPNLPKEMYTPLYIRNNGSYLLHTYRDGTQGYYSYSQGPNHWGYSYRDT